MKKNFISFSIMLGVFILFCVFVFWVLNDDDFNTYINETENVLIELEGNAYFINTVEPQILQIANKYLHNPTLSYVEYKYRNENDVNAMFFCSSEYIDEKYHDSLTINVDVINNTIYSVQYKYSNTKSATSYPVAYLKKDIDIKKYLNDIVEESGFKKYENAYIEFHFYFDEMISLILDDNGYVLWRSNEK